MLIFKEKSMTTNKEATSDSRYIISLHNVTKVFHGATEVTALQDVSLDIAKGEIFGIIGLSGAGKSTLVRCINLLEKPTTGEVLFCGQNLTTLKRKQLLKARHEIAMIFQNFNLFQQRTVLKNVMYPMTGDKNSNRQRALQLLETVGLSDKKDCFPSQLSGGQKQRVAIARALACNPKVLLCDEATSALDNATTASILQLLKQINQTLGVTVVVITHEMKVVESICDRVAVLDQSRLAETGTVRDVFLHPRSDIARQLILPTREQTTPVEDSKCLRLIFDGNTFNQPIVSSLAIDCNVRVNILFADAKTIDGKTYGQMVIGLPGGETRYKIEQYLQQCNVTFKEEELQ